MRALTIEQILPATAERSKIFGKASLAVRVRYGGISESAKVIVIGDTVGDQRTIEHSSIVGDGGQIAVRMASR